MKKIDRAKSGFESIQLRYCNPKEKNKAVLIYDIVQGRNIIFIETMKTVSIEIGPQHWNTYKH